MNYSRVVMRTHHRQVGPMIPITPRGCRVAYDPPVTLDMITRL